MTPAIATTPCSLGRSFSRVFAPSWVLFVAMICALAAPAWAQPNWRNERELGDPEIVRRYQEILARSPHSRQAMEGIQRQYEALGGMPALAEYYADRVAGSPENANLHIILARLRRDTDQDQAALSLVQRAIELGADDSSTFVLRADMRGRTGDLEGALADFEVALSGVRNTDEQVDILRTMGDMQRAIGRDDLALATYERISEVAPRDAFVREELAEILLEAGYGDQALEHLMVLPDLAGRDTRERARAHLAIAGLQTELGRYEEAIATWNTILGMVRPDNWLYEEAQNGIVRAYRSWGRLDLLLAEFDARVAEGTRDGFVLTNRARILAELGQAERARQAYDDAIAVRDDDPELRLEYAAHLQGIGDQAGAVVILDAAYLRWSDAFEVVVAVAEAHLAEGNNFDASFVLRSHEPAIWDNTSDLWEFFRLYQDVGDDRASERVSARIQALNPDDLRPLMRMAETALTNGRTTEGLAIVEQLMVSDDPWVHLDVINLLREQGYTDQADVVLESARMRFPASEDLALQWMRAVRTRGVDLALDVARELVLTADSDDIVNEAFTLYYSLLAEAGMEAWAADHFVALFERNPLDYRLGRVALMLQVVTGDNRGASATLAMLNATTPQHVYPEEWVMSTLRAWPSPDALPLLRRLGDGDPNGRWRYEMVGAQLLVEAGRYDEARLAMADIRDFAGDLPPVLFEMGNVYRLIGTPADLEQGCGLIAEASGADRRNATYRIGHIDCLDELGRVDEAYQVSLDGFDFVRDVGVADMLYDRAVAAIPSGVSYQQLGSAIRARVQNRGAMLNDWLDRRLTQ